MSTLDHRLSRLLGTTSFARVVPHLTPETLHQLVRHRGLEACGDLVTAATPAQLTSLLDLDLWHHALPGHDEQFDVDRFGEWLEVLIDAGESVAARIVSCMDPHLFAVGLSRHVRLFDPGTFEPTEQSDDEVVDRHGRMNSETGADVIECEVGGYLVRARREDAWDAIVALLVALDAEHHDCFHALMQGCRRLSNSRPEIDGLDDLLLAPDQSLHDVAVERNRRRARQGFATPAEARAFLQLARVPRAPAGTTPPRVTNPIAAAYFRAVDAAAADAAATPSGAGERAAPLITTAAAQDGADVGPAIDALVDLLIEAGMMPARQRLLPGGAPPTAGDTTHPLLTRLMAYVREHDDAAHLARQRELAFLANTLVAGCSVQARPFTAQEASDAAAAICNLGLECGPAPPDGFLVDHELVAVFEAGWSRLHRDVGLFAAGQLVASLGALHGIDVDVRDDVQALRRALERQRLAGTPWLARGAADVLAMLDMTVWAGVLGLLDECPILPAALIAVLEGQTTGVCPNAFAFIGTTAQIGAVHRFLRLVPDLLSH